MEFLQTNWPVIVAFLLALSELLASDTTNSTRKATHQLVVNNRTVAPSNTETIYVHLRGLSISGGTAFGQLDLGSYFNSDSVLFARRVS